MKAIRLKAILRQVFWAGPAASLLCSAAHGASIGVQFLGDSDQAGAAGTADWSLAPADVAGVVEQSHWNQISTMDGGDNVNVDQGLSSGLVDATGTGTSVQLRYVGNDAWNTSGTTETPNDKLMKGTLKRFGSDPLILSFTNLTVGTYDVYVYGNVDSGPVTLAASIGSQTNYWSEPASFDSGAGFSEASGGNAETPAEGNYIKFTGVTPVNGAITVLLKYLNGGNGLGVSAAQLVSTGNFPSSQAPTVFGASQQVHDVTVYQGSEASFTFFATNNASPAMIPAKYQWYKNGQAITNATGTNFTFLAGPSDNGAQIYVQASLPAELNLNNLSLTSLTGRVTILPSITYTNGLKVELFPGASRSDVEAGQTGPSTNITLASSFSLPTNTGLENYTRRVSGLFIPPVTGDYVFFLAADDDADLFLSTDNDPAHKQLIAREENWSSSGQWLTSGGNSSISQKRSDQFSPDGGATTPFAGGIHLIAGTPAYIEAVQHQGVGGDNLGVTYKLLTEADPEDNSASQLQATNQNIAFQTSPSTNLSFTTQPASVSKTAGETVTLDALAISDSEFQVQYQWFKNGALVTGATQPTQSFGASTADNNSQWYVVASTPGLSRTSTVATVTVTASSSNQAVITFSDQQDNDVEANPSIYTDAQGLPQGVTATFANFNNWNGDADHTPTDDNYLLYGNGDAPDSPSISFNTPVEVPSLWVTTGPFGQVGAATVTAYLNGVEKFSYVLNEKNKFLQVTNGAGVLIDSLVFTDYGDSEIDDITIQKAGTPSGSATLQLSRNNDNTVTVSWTGSGVLEQTSSLTAPNWQAAPNQSNPQTIPTNGNRMQFYRVRQ